MSSQIRVFLRHSRLIQLRNSRRVSYSGDGVTRSIAFYSRNLHQSSFKSSTGVEKRQHLTREEGSSEGSGVAVSVAKYSSLLESAKTQSQLSNREQFALVLKEFMSREKYRKGHVTFINMALERMEEFRLQKDLLTYNRLLDVFPKGRYRPKRLLDALWPRPLPQIELALELLTRMEDNNVWPDAVTYSILVEVFGKRSLPVEKCDRMSYWYDCYKDADPYWIEGDLPEDCFELSRLALKRIVNNDNITEHKLVPTSDHTSGFILSGHTEAQLQVLDRLSSILPQSGSPSTLLYVEGPQRIWVNKTAMHYFLLRLSNVSGAIDKDGEGAVVAVCMCNPPRQSSLQQWIQELQITYPYFRDATIVYNITTSDSSACHTLLDASRRAATLQDAVS